MPAIGEIVQKRSYLKKSEKEVHDSPSALIYEEDWEWESVHERDFEVAILSEDGSSKRSPPVRRLPDTIDDSDTEQPANVKGSSVAGHQRDANPEFLLPQDHIIPSSSPLLGNYSPVTSKRGNANAQSNKTSDEDEGENVGHHVVHHVGMYEHLLLPRKMGIVKML